MVPRPGHLNCGRIRPYSSPPDFNGDGIVDISDLLVLIESWGQDNPFVDIAPPFGDSVIDIMDLEVLMNHWLQEVEDPDLAAHWKLDEVEGNIAYDSADDNYGTLSGNPIWQPDAGYVAGALQLDGIDDYISTNNLLNPKFTEFSVFLDNRRFSWTGGYLTKKQFWWERSDMAWHRYFKRKPHH